MSFKLKVYNINVPTYIILLFYKLTVFGKLQTMYFIIEMVFTFLLAQSIVVVI